MAAAAKLKKKPKAKVHVNMKELLALPKRQRLRIAEALQDSVIAEEPVPVLTDAWKAELERRAAASDADPSRFMTQEQFDARMDELVKRSAKKRA